MDMRNRTSSSCMQFKVVKSNVKSFLVSSSKFQKVDYNGQKLFQGKSEIERSRNRSRL